MPEPQEAPKRYLVECQPYIANQYIDVIDLKQCNDIANNLFKQLKKEFEVDGSYNTDPVMVSLALMVNSFAHEMDKFNPDAEWSKDGFPEFCSLIGPNNGFQIIVKEKPQEAAPEV